LISSFMSSSSSAGSLSANLGVVEVKARWGYRFERLTGWARAIAAGRIDCLHASRQARSARGAAAIAKIWVVLELWSSWSWAYDEHGETAKILGGVLKGIAQMRNSRESATASVL
jgi:hypothetical protein